MTWLKMLITLIRLTGFNLMTPWRSPLLRWRLETYGVTDEQGNLLRASDLTASQFLSFTFHRRKEFLRFLRWASQI